jgi:transcriptional regulator with XRE-family HTH domain
VRQLAERAGVGFVTVSRIENDRMSPTVAMLEKLARALGITVRDFFPVERAKRRGRR